MSDDARMAEWLGTFGHPELLPRLAKAGFIVPRSLAALDDDLLSDLSKEIVDGELARKQFEVLFSLIPSSLRNSVMDG